MRLTDQDDPLRTWEYAERYLGVGTRTYSPFAADLDVSPGCHPQLGHDSFTVPTFWVSDEQGSYLRSGLSLSGRTGSGRASPGPPASSGARRSGRGPR